MFIFLVPFIVNAESNIDEDLTNYSIVSTNEKYYKTIYVYNNSNISLNSVEKSDKNFAFSYTTEVTKEEYDSYDEEVVKLFESSNSTEKSYKKMEVVICIAMNWYGKI